MRIYWLQTITPLHVGSGKGIGFIDMPIMREKVTKWPLIPGSAVKGVIRDCFREKGTAEQKQLLDKAFGVGGDDTGSAGSLVLTDARIVCMPVRSLYGTFAYVTSRLVLERLKRDMIAAGYKEIPEAPEQGENDVLHTQESKLFMNNTVYFEDLDFIARLDINSTQKWAEMLAKAIFSTEPKWQSIFKERFAIVSDNSFNFLSETGTEVTAHVRIEDDRKIAAKGALWYEEALPIETILAGIAWCDRVWGGNGINQEKILDTFCRSALELQIGGKATVGKGRVRCIFTKG
jgi:CRISPR-associated protein Cmr4